jgi:hypothetical protein
LAVLAAAMASVLLLCSRQPLAAQTGREALLQGHQAYDFAEFDRAIGLLEVGLDPQAGPPDSLWVAGLHKLVHALIESGQESLAGIWLRWALRHVPDLAADSVNFPPSVVAAFRAAQGFVANSRLPALARAGWRWPAQPPGTGAGSLLMEAGAVAAAGRVEGGGFLAPGVPQTLAPGSYTVLATAEGYLPARATIEVLPGVTTILRFNLEPAAAGFLYVASRPWGVVSVNGQRIGYTTIAAYRLPAGTHRVRIERPGYVPFDTTVSVTERDQRLRLGTIELKPERR